MNPPTTVGFTFSRVRSCLHLARRAAVVMSVLFLSACSKQPSAQQLFVQTSADGDVPHQPIADTLSQVTVLESATVRSRLLQFDANAKRVMTSGEAKAVGLQLFSDVAFEIQLFEQPPPTSDSKVWAGPLGKGIDGEYTLILRNGMLAGTIFAGQRGTFTISPGPNGALRISQVNQSALPECSTGSANLPNPEGFPLPQPDVNGKSDDGSLIDVMVVYTPTVVMLQGSEDATRIMIEHAIHQANTALASSGCGPRFRLVRMSQVDYIESGTLEVDLPRLRERKDGFMDDVHAWRDECRADLVSLIVGDASDACGLAWVLPNDPDYAFSTIVDGCTVANISFAHELAHNLGCCHHRSDKGDCEGETASSHGWRFKDDTYRTIMSYEPGERILRFSNPASFYYGSPTGSDDANNAQTINQTAKTVANHRVSSP